MADTKPPRKPYSSDLTAEQWAILQPLFPSSTRRGRRQYHSLKDILDAIFYINTNGCKWRDLPHDFPPYTSVSHHYTKWMRDGTWRRINNALREAVRQQAGRDPRPSAAALDSQTTKAAATGGYRGYDGAKKTTGRKRHTLVDTLGLLIVVFVTAASVSDAYGAIGLLRQVSRFEQPRLTTIFVDGAYHRQVFDNYVASQWYEVQVVKRPEGVAGFVPIRKRWVVERTFGWLAHYRRHARDYERTYESSESQIYISHIRLLLRRLTKSAPPPDSAPGAITMIPGIAA